MTDEGIRIGNELKAHMDAKKPNETMHSVAALLGCDVPLSDFPVRLRLFVEWYLTKIKVFPKQGKVAWLGSNEANGCIVATAIMRYRKEQASSGPVTPEEIISFERNWQCK